MKKTFTVLLAVFIMLACVSCMDRTRDNTGYWNDANPNPNANQNAEPYGNPNVNPNLNTTPGTIDSLDYLR